MSCFSVSLHLWYTLLRLWLLLWHWSCCVSFLFNNWFEVEWNSFYGFLRLRGHIKFLFDWSFRRLKGSNWQQELLDRVKGFQWQYWRLWFFWDCFFVKRKFFLNGRSNRNSNFRFFWFVWLWCLWYRNSYHLNYFLIWNAVAILILGCLRFLFLLVYEITEFLINVSKIVLIIEICKVLPIIVQINRKFIIWIIFEAI